MCWKECVASLALVIGLIILVTSYDSKHGLEEILIILNQIIHYLCISGPIMLLYGKQKSSYCFRSR